MGNTTLLSGIIQLFYPRCCPGCDQALLRAEGLICVDCRYFLPVTGFHRFRDNDAARQLWGRVPFDRLASYLYMHKKSRVESMVYQLKYHNRPSFAYALGMEYGRLLQAETNWIAHVDLIIPVPLHPIKLRKRGYNQSERFGRGLADSLGKPCVDQVLVRTRDRGTLTQKSRYERYESLKDVLLVKQVHRIKNAHVLLVDDVLTTGATLEACGLALRQATDVKLSAVTIARKVR